MEGFLKLGPILYQFRVPVFQTACTHGCLTLSLLAPHGPIHCLLIGMNLKQLAQ
jgi:hypothetical protein